MRSLSAVLLCLALVLGLGRSAIAADALPALTAPVNDFAKVIDGTSAAEIDRVIRALQAATGDTVVVVTVPTVEPYADVREYAVKLFENQGRGIGQKGKDNGILIVLALKERRVWIEVGYGLEEWITDGFAGETSREVMAPLFRDGRYGPGMLAGVERIVGRIAQARNVSIEGVQAPRPLRRETGTPIPLWVILMIFFFAVLILSRIGGGRGRRSNRYWRGGPGSGWSSGVGPFGGGWGGGWGGGFGSGGGFGGGGFGGGFGGFGGGRSGGGGGGAGW